MNLLLLLCAVVLLASILGSKLSGRLGIPTLFFFIAHPQSNYPPGIVLLEDNSS